MHAGMYQRKKCQKMYLHLPNLVLIGWYQSRSTWEACGWRFWGMGNGERNTVGLGTYGRYGNTNFQPGKLVIARECCSE